MAPRLKRRQLWPYRWHVSALSDLDEDSADKEELMRLLKATVGRVWARDARSYATGTSLYWPKMPRN